jgi:diguanylate cyclase
MSAGPTNTLSAVAANADTLGRSSLRDLPLAWRLGAASLAALMLGIGLTVAVLLGAAQRALETEQVVQERSEAARAARVLQREVTALQMQLAQVALVAPAVAVSGPERAMAYLESASALYGRFDSLFITDRDGRMLAYRDERGMRATDVSIADRPYFQQALHEARPVVSSPLIDRASGEPSVVLAHPLSAGGRVIGTLNGAIRPRQRDLMSALVESEDLGDTVLMLVTDGSGLILTHPDRTKVGATLASEDRLRAAWQDWQRSGRPIESSGQRLPAADDLVAAAAVNGTDWIVWRWHAGDAVRAPLDAARNSIIVGATLLALVLAAGLGVVLWWQLRPMQRLQARAEVLLDDRYPVHEGWLNASGEIGRLERVLRRVAADRAVAEVARSRILRELSLVMSTAPVALMLTRERRFDLVSRHAAELFGCNESELVGEPAQMIFASNEDYQSVGPQVVRAFAQRLPYLGEWPCLRKDGRRFPARFRAQPVDWDDASAGTLWTVEDITTETAERHALQHAALHDALTGLANRALLEQRLAQIEQRGIEAPASAVLVIDLDRFKPINDTHGHAAGDAMLRAIAHTLSERVRVNDLVARVGGDEFVVLLEGCAADVAVRLAEDVAEAVDNLKVHWQGQALQVGASVGLATRLAGDVETAVAWLQRADLHCYEVKRGRHLHRAAPVSLRAVPA